MKLNKLLLVAIVAVALASTVGAIGLSPSSATVNGVLRGSYSEATFNLYNTEPEEVAFSLSIIGPMAGWVNFSPSNRIVTGPMQVSQVTLVMSPPADTPNGNYAGQLLVVGQPTGSAAGGTVSKIATGVQATVNINVVDVETRSVEVIASSIRSVEVGQPIIVSVKVKNTGNVKATPTVNVKIVDNSGATVQTFSKAMDEILPTRTAQQDITFDSAGIPLGQYTAVIEVDYDGKTVSSDNLEFDVLAVGALRRSGELTDLNSTTTASVGQLVQITGTFNNNGELASQAKLEADILLDGTLLDHVEGDEISVNPGETTALEVLYRPTHAGVYTVNAYVLYSERRTPVRSFIITVNGSTALSFDLYYVLAIAIIAAIIAYAIWSHRQQQPAPKAAAPQEPQPPAASAQTAKPDETPRARKKPGKSRKPTG